MDENQLRDLLSTISHLAQYGEIPINAFGSLISSARGELLAEHLHQRWLSDPNFAQIAADIVFQLHGIVNRNVVVTSQVLSLVLRDFKGRRKIRRKSRHMYRNYMRTLIALFPVYRKIDKYLSACLIEPLFRSLNILLDDEPDDLDLRCLAIILIANGQKLNQLNPSECANMIIKCRRWLILNSIKLEEETKFLIMNAFDQWTYSWEMDLFPDALRNFYEKESSQKILKNTFDEVLKRKFSQEKEWLPKNDKIKQSEREESIV